MKVIKYAAELVVTDGKLASKSVVVYFVHGAANFLSFHLCNCFHSVSRAHHYTKELETKVIRNILDKMFLNILTT